jgi:hypothetical protein
MASQFRKEYERYPDLEGLVAEMLAREQQQKFMATDIPGEAPGCLLGWLMRRRE